MGRLATPATWRVEPKSRPHVPPASNDRQRMRIPTPRLNSPLPVRRGRTGLALNGSCKDEADLALVNARKGAAFRGVPNRSTRRLGACPRPFNIGPLAVRD